MSQVIYFIETNTGEREYKLDSFWSRSKNYMNSKIHSSEDDAQRFFESLCYGFKPYKSLDSDLKPTLKLTNLRSTYVNSKYGYQIILTDRYIQYLEEGIEVGEPIYYKVITDILDDFTVISEDYTRYNRDNKIDEILN